MKRDNLIKICLAFIISFSLFINYKRDSLIWYLLLIPFVYLLLNKNNYSSNKKDIILSIVYAFFYLICQCAMVYGDITRLFNIFLLIRIFCLYILFNYLISFIKKVIDYYLKSNDLKENKFIKLFNNHSFLISLLVIIFAWSIYYVAYYPGILSKDPSYQIKQFFGEKTKYLDYNIQINPNVTITNHHPVLHTIILGQSIKLGKSILNDNFGIFIYTFIQGLILAITLSYTIYFLKKHNIKNKYLIFMLFAYAFIPAFAFYALNTNKDVYYTILIIWLTIFLFEFVDKYKNKSIPIKYYLLSYILLLLICLFRNNGIFIIIFLLLFLVFYSKYNYKKIIILFTMAFLSFICYKNILLPKIGITPTSVREALSVPFQQTARDIKYHEDNYSEEEKDIINKILDYNKIKEKYKPNISDPVKNTFNKYSTKDDLKEYFKVWFKHLFKSPVTYINATIDNTYGYVYPFAKNWYIYYKYVGLITENNLVNYHYNSLDSLRNVLAIFGEAFPYIPVLGLTMSIGFNSWILIAIFIYLIKTKKSKYLICLIPMYISLLVCFVSPVNTYFRYAMPYIFPMFLVIGFLQKKEL